MVAGFVTPLGVNFHVLLFVIVLTKIAFKK